MSSASSSDNKLIATAIGAAVAGAALGIAALKFMERSEAAKAATPLPNPRRSSISSIIYEDTADEMGARAAGDTLVFPHNHEEKMRRRIVARAAVEEDNVMPRDSVTVRVPATSANMGPGCESSKSFYTVSVMVMCQSHRLILLLCFLLDDTIGMAVDLWSEVTVERSDKFEITAEGLGAEQMPKDESNYMVVGCKAAFEAAQKPMPTLKYHVVSRIPFARGLGSSSAGIVSGIVAGLILAGHRLPCWGSESLLQIAAGIEVRW